jgi:molybdopterin-guanine dinucleotide biosynthesis protein A
MATPDGRIANVSGAVLLGGASRRMGRDKTALDVGGVPAASRLAGLLSQLFEEVLLVGGTPPPGAPGRPVADVGGPRSALRGLVGALSAARGERVLVLACDLVLVTPELLLALVAWPDADAVVPRTQGRAHPLCALYQRDAVLPVAEARLAGERLALHALLRELDTAYLEDADLEAVDPDGSALTNVNTAEDLERARARLEPTAR